MKRLSNIAFATFLLSSALACSKSSSTDEADTPKQKSTPVETMFLKPVQYKEYGEYIGQIKAIKEARLISYAGGRVNKIKKDRGSLVKKGEELCSIEGDKFDTQFESTKLAEKLSKEKLDRTQRHVKKGTASRTEVDRARMKYLGDKQLRLEAEKARNGSLCVSPITGVIVDRKIEEYDETSPGQATFYVADTSRVKVTIGIPESEIDGYKVGNEAFLSIKGQNLPPIKGKVVSLAQKVDQIQRTFLMDLEFPNDKSAIRTGMTGRIKVLRFNFKNRLVIPTETIIVLASQKAVMTVKDSKAVKKPIQVTSSNETQSLIAKGLSFGDELITKGQMQAVDGTPVQVVNQK